MSNISMVETKLPPGFRFHPRDEELVCDYLMKKVTHSDYLTLLIEVDLNKSEPWDIPESACVGGKEWYFYSQRDRKYATGLRTNRATATGYWKATGKDRPIFKKGTSQLVGMRKTLVFYKGRAPKGSKSDWVMHEFRLEGPFGPPKLSPTKEDWVLCRVFYKNRELVAPPKPAMPTSITCYYEDDAGSSSHNHHHHHHLPPLMDSHINFDASTHFQHDNEYHQQQGPCFSAINDTLFFNDDQMMTTDPVFTGGVSGGSSNAANATSFIDNNADFECDNKEVVKAVLSQLTKMESSSCYPNYMTSSVFKGSSASSFGGGQAAGSSSDDYLVDHQLGVYSGVWSRY